VVFAYSRLQTSLFPEITFPKIKIIADAGLQPVNKMMVTVTKPLENAVKQVPDLHYVRSTTSRGSCEISAYMNWDADIDLSQQRIESRIAQIKNIPCRPKPMLRVEKMNPSILPVSGYTLESHNLSPIELKQLATYTVKPFLSQVDGVSEITGDRWQNQRVLAGAEPPKNELAGLNARHDQQHAGANGVHQKQRLPV
jgi:multidrug efflux pump subunit AcrB